MIRVILSFIITFVNFCLQTTWFKEFNIPFIEVNSAIVFIICFSLSNGEYEGAAIGLFSGLLQDIMYGRFIGFYALVSMYLGFFCGLLNRRFVKDNVFVAILFSFVGTIVYEFSVYFFFFLAQGQMNVGVYLTNKILPEAIGNAILTIFVFRYITRPLDEKFNKSVLKNL